MPKQPSGSAPGRIAVNLDPELARKVRIKAAEQGRRINELVAEVLSAYLKESR
jgi:predicted HicB family RNase H-like nuclease